MQATSAGPGQGTEFTVSLPIRHKGDVADGTPAPAADGSVTGRKILVVDDNADAASSLAALLQMSGHSVATAHDGAEALRLARDDPPDTALLDLGLPGMDGYEVARRMRELPGLAATRLIAMTGYGHEAHRRESDKVGFDDHLVKPVEYSDLLRAIEGRDAAR